MPPSALAGRFKMSATLTTWKEIAAYLGKGVRTVQRWEVLLDLPVRRPQEKGVTPIFALPSEIDEWVRSRTDAKHTSVKELENCREHLKTLEAENDKLREGAGHSS
jgi:predicted DNA-binding transcriptional regulator AlpA